MESAPVEKTDVKKGVTKPSFLKRGAKFAATLLVGANLDKVPLPSFDTPSNENNNRPVPEAVENTLSPEQEKEIIADKLDSVSKHPDLAYYKAHINDVNPELIEASKSRGLIVENIDLEKYNHGLMIRAVEILLKGRWNVQGGDKIEISVHLGVPCAIKYENAEYRNVQFDFRTYLEDLSFPEEVAARGSEYDTGNISTITVSREAIESALANSKYLNLF